MHETHIAQASQARARCQANHTDSERSSSVSTPGFLGVHTAYASSRQGNEANAARAQETSHKFAAEFHAALPPELLDHVYTYLVDSEKVFMNEILRATCPLSQGLRTISASRRSNIISPLYMRNIVAKEITSAFYEHIFRHPRTRFAPRCIPNLITGDPLSTGFTATSYIKIPNITCLSYMIPELKRSFEALAKALSANLITVNVHCDYWCFRDWMRQPPASRLKCLDLGRPSFDAS
jgi:hypothetical protein